MAKRLEWINGRAMRTRAPVKGFGRGGGGGQQISGKRASLALSLLTDVGG